MVQESEGARSKLRAPRFTSTYRKHSLAKSGPGSYKSPGLYLVCLGPNMRLWEATKQWRTFEDIIYSGIFALKICNTPSDGYGVPFLPYDPNIQPVIQDPVGMNLYGTLLLDPWEQWLSTGNTAFADTAHIAAPNAFALEHQQQYVQYAYDQESPTQWASNSTSMHSYPIPSPSTESTSVENATGDLESRRGSSSTQPDKRKRNAIQPTASKAPKRSRTKPEAVSGKSKGRRKAKAVAKPQPTKKYPSAEPEEELDEHSKKAKERQRIASNKFRVKKRQEAQKLRADEQGMERTHHQLSSCVSELITQVYNLKMELLRHTDCECRLIQNYIANEAHRYIQDLGAGKVQHATPPLCPYNQHS